MFNSNILDSFIGFCDIMIIAMESRHFILKTTQTGSNLDKYRVSISDVNEHSLKLHKDPDSANLNHSKFVSYYTKKFHDPKILTSLINTAIAANHAKINSKLTNTKQIKFPIDYDCSELVGYVLDDYSSQDTQCIRIVLGSDQKRSEIHFVTAYPYPKNKCTF